MTHDEEASPEMIKYNENHDIVPGFVGMSIISRVENIKNLKVGEYVIISNSTNGLLDGTYRIDRRY